MKAHQRFSFKLFASFASTAAPLTLVLAGLLSAKAFAFFGPSSSASNHRDIEYLNWGPIDVVFIEDNRFPLFYIDVYYADGALSDKHRQWGETEMMFDGLTMGTDRYHQKEILDALEYYALSMGTHVTHEYSLLSLSGLMKDLVPSLKMVCHVLQNSIYPQKELKKHKRRLNSHLKNLVSSPGSLANRAIRMVSLEDTPYGHPTGGTLKSIGRIDRSALQAKRDYFNKKVKKTIYIAGPRILLGIKPIIEKECLWTKTESRYQRKVAQPYRGEIAKKGDKIPVAKDLKKIQIFIENKDSSWEKNLKNGNPPIYFVPLKSGNQGQIRLSRFLSKDLLNHPERMQLASHILGGSFTALLMQELRVKRGLTYSVRAQTSPQKEYGRLLIATFSKDPTITESLSVIKKVLSVDYKTAIDAQRYEQGRNNLLGKYLFSIETSKNYLGKILEMRHRERPLKEFFDFPQTIKEINRDQALAELARLYQWEKLVIVVVGNKKLKKTLQEFSQVIEVPVSKLL